MNVAYLAFPSGFTFNLMSATVRFNMYLIAPEYILVDDLVDTKYFKLKKTMYIFSFFFAAGVRDKPKTFFYLIVAK